MRVVEPELSRKIFVTDPQIRMAVFFLTQMATILTELQLDLVRGTWKNKVSVDYDLYADKIERYEVVFDEVLATFEDDMFGVYSNSVVNAEFRDNVKAKGWKYFSLKNLNELFFIKYKELRDAGRIEDQEHHDTVMRLTTQGN